MEMSPCGEVAMEKLIAAQAASYSLFLGVTVRWGGVSLGTAAWGLQGLSGIMGAFMATSETSR